MNSADKPVAMDPERSMKPLLAIVIREALHLALLDSSLPDEDDRHPMGLWTDEEKAQMRLDIYAIPLKGIDPGALAQNLACRLLGTGGWQLGAVYTSNATPQEVFDLSVDRPHRDDIAQVAVDLGLHPEDDDA